MMVSSWARSTCDPYFTISPRQGAQDEHNLRTSAMRHTERAPHEQISSAVHQTADIISKPRTLAPLASPRDRVHERGSRGLSRCVQRAGNLRARNRLGG